MGQLCSRDEARDYIKKDLSIPIEREELNSIDSNKHVFQCLISSTWLHAVRDGSPLRIDSELYEYKENNVKLSEIFKSGYESPSGSCVFKVSVTALKKEVNFVILCEDEDFVVDNKSIFNALQNQQYYTRSLYDKYLEMYGGDIINSCKEIKKDISMDELKDFFKNAFNIPIRMLDSQVLQNSNNFFERDHHSFASTPFLSVLAILESPLHIYVVEKHLKYNLNDALSYSPALLGKNHMNFRFLIYQLMHLLLELSKQNWVVNTQLQLKDFHLLYNTLWIGTSLFDCVSVQHNAACENSEEPLIQIFKGRNTDLRESSIQLTKTLSEYTCAWCEGKISNFDYLVILNKLAGKKFGEPLNHPIFPWVTDFSFHNGGLRNLKRTKFRLNKGDNQLDATFTSGVGAFGLIQHHVSDILSDITFYIYNARKTPKQILCSHVRSRWVPDEYPASMERIYNWTPDECIPEFFYDPKIFKSEHEDLNDLKFPSWINSAEEFVDYHYSVLESAEVSENLHHWIDLIFGYKLEGKAARREKNVHLALVDNHKDLKNYGVVQLFDCQHPMKKVTTEQRLQLTDQEYNETDGIDRRRGISMSWEYVDLTSSMKINKDETIARFDQEDFSIRRKPTKAIVGDINLPNISTTVTVGAGSSSEDESIASSFKYKVKDPGKQAFSDIMERTEKMLNFELMLNMPSDKGIGKYEFGSSSKEQKKSNINQFSHLDEKVKLFLSLLIEMTCHRALCSRTFIPELDERLLMNWKFMSGNKAVPNWIKDSVEKVLFSGNISYQTISISPDTSLCLNSLLMTSNVCFRFPAYYKKMYEFLSSILSLTDNCEHFEDFDMNENDTVTEYIPNNLSQEIERCCKDLPVLLDKLDEEGVDLILLYLNPLFERTSVQVPMFLYVFPSLSVSLGPLKSRKVFVKGLQQLMDRVNTTVTDPALMQQTFISHIVSGFGQDYFLKYFMSILLDVLALKKSHSFVTTRNTLQKASSISTIPGHEMSLQKESLVSYEVSPYLATDSISLSSFHLDQMFAEVPLTLGRDTVDYSGDLEDGKVQTLQKTSNEISFKPASFNLPVSSSQEVGNLINVETGCQSLPSFSFKEQNIDVNDGRFDHCFIDSNEEELKSPFTVLLDIDDDSEVDDLIKGRTTTDLSEVLEVPFDETIDIAGVEDDRENETETDGIHKITVQSIRWFISWLGPNITTEFIAMPLLRKMGKLFIEVSHDGIGLDIVDCYLEKIAPHIDCLVEVANVYGDNIVIYLYLPHISKLIENATMSSSVSISLGSNLVAGVQLLLETCIILQREEVASYMEEFSNGFFQPLVRLLSTIKPFSTGVIVKEFLSRKMIDILGSFCQKLRREYAQEVIAPLLQQFFSCFDGIYALNVNPRGVTTVKRKYTLLCSSSSSNDSKRGRGVQHETINEMHFGGSNNISSAAALRISSNSLTIEDVLENDQVDAEEGDIERFDDIYQTFSSSLAYHAYVLFCRVLGNRYVEETLYNNDLIYKLFEEHNDRISHEGSCETTAQPDDSTDGASPTLKRKISKWFQTEQSLNEDENITQSISWQNLDGNWLKNWKEWSKTPLTSYQFSNYKLQTYAGHSSAIRDISVADNEHYFLSASRDKTVKLWLLRNHGNGTAHLGCSGTYDRHIRAVFAVQGIESKRLAASCDGIVNIWDPVTTTTISHFDGGRGHTITCMRTLPQPSVCVAVATTEGNMRIYDVRQKSFVQNWNLSPQQATGMVRSMCVNETGTWIASGFSSGIFSVIDLRAGILKGQAFIHDGEIMQMEAVSGYGFLCSTVDSHIKLWKEDGKVSVVAKSSGEYLKSMVYSKQQLLWATATNKMMIHSSEKITHFESHRINPDFKGALSKMAVLPTNRLFLFGADNGNLVLYA